MTSKTTKIVFWATTILFAVFLGWSAVMYLTEAPKMTATMTHLGYPLYFMKALGVAKLLGIAALLFGPARLREWAYAGFTFDLLGASVSHLSSGDGIATAAVPIAFLALLAASYVMARRLGITSIATPLLAHRPAHARA